MSESAHQAALFRRGRPEYNAWMNAKARCHRLSHPRYPDWGGKGIKVCDSWRHDFPRFLADVGPRPGPGFSLDRINGSKDYEPGNVRWATAKEQSINRPSWVNTIEFKGQTKTLTDWADIVGVSRKTLENRLKRWPIEEALTTPKLAHRGNAR